MKNTLNIILGLGLLGALLYGVFKTLGWLYSHILAVDPRISAALITGLIAIIATSLTITIPKYLEKKMEIEEHLREKKSETYKELVELLFKVLMGSKTGNSLTEKELIQSMSKFTENLILWGSEDVIKSYKSYRDYFINRTSGQELSLESIQIMENLLLSIRRDMGHKNKNLEKGDILSLFINDLDKVLERLKVS
ncbi:hypothetical protein [Rossellomorea arthrocnemi]|jgi:hypothetical protein|uniref:hypothetical protein n=1 Tax=Rossellomorea arthrocnemi TaxID=2769542 RepID=UPI001918868D|nr:hypothetical protein [Rossellomorea arthrocnemi]